MQSSQIPDKSQRVFAQSAGGTYVRTIPQTTSDPAAASYDLGFPPQTFTDESAGGTPPDGRDFNGILNHLDAWRRWFAAGGAVKYDATFQSAIGGYPLGAIVMSAVTNGLQWLSTAENNTSNPDSGGAGWMVFLGRGASAGEVAAGTEDRKVVTPKSLRDSGGIIVTSSNLNENNGYRVYSDGFKECWGFTTVPDEGNTVITLPVSHSSWFNISIAPNVKNTSDAQDNTGILSRTGLTAFTITNKENTAIRVDWSTRGV